MRQIVNKIVGYLEKKGVTNPADHQVYVYGADSFLYTIVSTIGLMLIGGLGGRFWETIVIIAVFYTNQSLGGGYHATTHISCFLTMVIGLICCLATLYIPLSMFVSACLGIVALAILSVFPLVLHPNKSYLEKKRALLQKRSRCALFIQSAVMAVIVVLKDQILFQAFSIALLCSGLSRLTAVCRNKRQIRKPRNELNGGQEVQELENR